MPFPKKDPTLTPLVVGTPAPHFQLPASGLPENQYLSLDQLKGHPFVLVFYPKDKTPGCTKQLCALQEDLAQFNKLNAKVIASNSGSLKSHESFAEKYGYQFPILVDADKAMAQAYCVLKAEGGIQRTVYVVDAEGVIRFAQQGLPAPETLLAVIEEWTQVSA
jgi:thioredoxin-dependent peroxiredoxin